MEDFIKRLGSELADVICARLDERLQAVEESSKPHFLTRFEAANFLKISLPTLHKFVNEGKLHPLKIGGRRLFAESDLLAAMEAGVVCKYQRFN